MSTNAVNDELLTVREAATRYKLSITTIRSWIRKGVIPHQRIGPYRLIRLRSSDLEATVTADDKTL